VNGRPQVIDPRVKSSLPIAFVIFGFNPHRSDVSLASYAAAPWRQLLQRRE
jgi:hypothetical protein